MALMALPIQFEEALRNPRSMRPTCLKEGVGAPYSGLRERASPN
jgi:hypothetical protein